MNSDFSRRDVLRLAAAGGLGAVAARAEAQDATPGPSPRPGSGQAPKAPKMPVVFVSHGSPMFALQKNDYTKALARLGTSIPTPKAVAIISAHWMNETPVKIGGVEKPSMIYDFHGFPKALYEVKYEPPGAPKVAADAVALLKAGGIGAELDAERGIDHGVWVPMGKIYPGADLPTFQIALSWDLTPAQMLDVGAKLAPLRERGVLIVASGGWTHNLGGLDGQEEKDLATRFDAWAREKLERFDTAALADYRKQAPGVDQAHPSTDHWDVLYTALGAATKGEPIRDYIEGARGTAMSLRTFTIG